MLFRSQANFDKPELMRCERMKKFLNYLGEGVTASFWHDIRRVKTEAEFHRICAEHFDHDRLMTMEPEDSGQRAQVRRFHPIEERSFK